VTRVTSTWTYCCSYKVYCLEKNKDKQVCNISYVRSRVCCGALCTSIDDVQWNKSVERSGVTSYSGSLAMGIYVETGSTPGEGCLSMPQQALSGARRKEWGSLLPEHAGIANYHETCLYTKLPGCLLLACFFVSTLRMRTSFIDHIYYFFYLRALEGEDARAQCITACWMLNCLESCALYIIQCWEICLKLLLMRGLRLVCGRGKVGYAKCI
jgi:hypothetical protein